ncbi:MAG: tetratricopeptide repeat protein, partial [Bacteroidota bacterium]
GKAKVHTLNELTTQLLASKQFGEANQYAVQANELARTVGDASGEARALDNLALCYQAKYDYTNAMKFFVNGLKIRDELKVEKEIATSKNNIGKLFYLQEDISSALDNLNAALAIRQKVNDQEGAAVTHKNLADVFLFKQLYGKAKEHYRQAMDLMIELEDYTGASGIASFLGNIVSDLGDYEGALVYYNMSLDLNSSIEDLPSIAKDFNNIAEAHLAQGTLDEALEANETAFGIRKKEADQLGLAESYKNFGVIYAKMGDATAAKKNLAMSTEALKSIGAEPGTQDIYKAIADSYVTMGDFSNAYAAHVAYATSRDILFNKEKSTALLELTTKYESEFEAEKQSQRIDALEKEKTHAARIRSFLFALIGLACLLLMVLYSSYRRKQKDNQLLVAKNEEINRQKEEIDLKNVQLKEKNASLDLLNQKLVEEMAERESIEQSSFARDRFLATMSHEMRTPMNIIIGLTHLLLEENPRMDQVEHLRTLQFSANNLVVFINDVLDFSKIEAGKLTLESREFNPLNTFEDTKERFRLPASDKDIRLNYTVDEKMPQKLVGDPVRLNQIMTNLVSNAIQHTDVGQVDVGVKLHELNAKEVTMLITIADTGKGIEQDQLDEMFRQFSGNSGDIFEGYAGLGLAITKRLVDLQNGKIEVESTPGKGTKFTVYLPYKIADENEPTVDQANEVKSFDHLAGHKILLVEDNKINQLVVAKMLRKLGIEIVTADNGLEALDAFSVSYFDLVLMDIQMPKMDGYRATAEIRKSNDPRKRDVPIIALTASAFLTEKEKAKLFGMNDHVGKPFGPEDLLDKISNCLKMYKTV